MPRQFVGIDLGGTKTQGVILDQRGEPLGRAVADTPAELVAGALGLGDLAGAVGAALLVHEASSLSEALGPSSSAPWSEPRVTSAPAHPGLSLRDP